MTKLEISKKKLREEVLKRIKFMRTCVLARELCLLIRSNRAILEPKDVEEVCIFISNLCKEENCDEPSALCMRAVNALNDKDEKNYLELCAKSCMKCGEAKRPPPMKNAYVS